jgi:hypothetical protein
MKRESTSRPHAGPSLLWLALVHIALFVASLVAGSLLRHGSGFVTPFSPPEAVQQFFASNSEAVRVSAFLFFASSVPFGIYAATIVSRLRFLGVRAAGCYIALLGGFAAFGAIALSSLYSWVLSVPEVSASLPETRALYFLSFLSGGVGFAVTFGLLAAGVSVTSHFFRLLPRWLVWFGLVIAVAGELSVFSLISYPANFFIPVTRYLGFIWLIAVGVSLPNTIGTRPETSADTDQG